MQSAPIEPVVSFLRGRFTHHFLGVPHDGVDPSTYPARLAYIAWAHQPLETNRFRERTDLRAIANLARHAAEMIAVAIELEGEKRALSADRQWAQLNLTGEAREEHVLGLARQLHVGVDTQLEHLVALRHLLSNIVRQTVLAHPRFKTINLETHGVGKGVAKWIRSTDKWPSESKKLDQAINEVAGYIDDPLLLVTTARLVQIDPSDLCQKVVDTRDPRHHRGSRGVPPGVHIDSDEFPTLTINGRTYATGLGSYDPITEAHTKLSTAGQAATNLLDAGLGSVTELGQAWYATMCHLHSPPVRPLDWDDPFVPKPAETGQFPYAIRFTVESPDALHNDRSFFNRDRKVALLACLPDLDHTDAFTTIQDAQDYGEALTQLRNLLEGHGHVLIGWQPLRSW